MKALELKKNFYWTGVLDRDLKTFDIIMETKYGTTYNSYLLKGSEKTVLFETAKAAFFEEYLETIDALAGIDKIDYIVVNHTEPDHAGSIERLLERNPEIQVVGTAAALGFLKHIVNRSFQSIPVKENDTLSLGDKTLRFFVLPNLHWPDTMYTYVEEDKTLLTCDSFGAHYCFDGILRSKVTAEADYWDAAKYYFDCIIGPFKPFMQKALKRIAGLEFDMICTGHGPVLDCKIPEILEAYGEWSAVENPNQKPTVILAYVSAYGYTKTLAEEIARGIRESGDIAVRLYNMEEADQAKVLEECQFADGILLGTPTIVGEALKPIWDLSTSMHASIHGKKLAGAFGSYGWSGEGVPHITERLKQLKMDVVDGFRVRMKPGTDDLKNARRYGRDFGRRLLGKEAAPAAKPEAPTPAAQPKKKMVRCTICNQVFEEGPDKCPFCGVGKEYFEPVAEA